MSEEPKEAFSETFNRMLEEISPSDLTTALFRERPYDGQPHTDLGIRGKQLLVGITFRDVQDAFIRGCYLASGLSETDYPSSLYELPWEHMDPIAVAQCMSCEIEKMMGIYPNVPGLDIKNNEATD